MSVPNIRRAEGPPPLPASAAPSAGPAGGRSAAGAKVTVPVAWLVILGVLGIVAYRNWAQSRAARYESAEQDVLIEIAGRTAVGYHTLFGHLPQASANEDELLFSVERAAHSAGQRLDAAAVLGEVRGSSAALAELNAGRAFFKDKDLASAADAMRVVYTRGADALGDSQRHDLTSRGWFGRLALGYGRPAGDPGRAAVIAAAVRAVAAGLLFEIVILVAVLAGITLLVLTLVRVVLKGAPRAYRPAAHAAPFVEAFALYLAGYFFIPSLLRRHTHASGGVIELAALGWIALACAWPLARGVPWAELRRGLGWTAGRGVLREVGSGVVLYLAGLPLVIVAGEITWVLGKLTGERAVHPIMFEAGGGWRQVLMLYLLAAVFAPVVEETMFRGALFHHLRSRHRWLFSAVVSSLVFAGLHPQGWTALPVLGTIGFVFCAIREWRGTVAASAAAHALNNALVTTMLVMVMG